MTYTNVVVMGYLEETGQLTPEWRLKLETALSAGWQRLLTFEVAGGGFEWYGRGPASTILSAYGVMELADMDRVFPIDRRLVDRAVGLLFSRQQRDGSWKLDVPVHTWHQLSNASLPVTAYVTWALGEAGLQGREIQLARAYVEAHRGEATDPYVKALVALALGTPGSHAELERLARSDEEKAWWTASTEGLCHARGHVADIEATALAALALQRGTSISPLADRALAWLAQAKDARGSWHSTQATILAIKALLEGGRAPRKVAKDVAIRLRVNGREIIGAFRPIGGDTRDVVQQCEIPVDEGDNLVELEADGDLRAAFQVAGRFHVPWDQAPAPASSPLRISTVYHTRDLAAGDILNATTTLEYTGRETFMVIADLGIPPGFTPDTSAFDRLVADGVIDKYAVAGRQISVYLGRVSPGRPVEIRHSFRARFPLEARIPRTRAWEYYSPENEAGAGVSRIRVR